MDTEDIMKVLNLSQKLDNFHPDIKELNKNMKSVILLGDTIQLMWKNKDAIINKIKDKFEGSKAKEIFTEFDSRFGKKS